MSGYLYGLYIQKAFGGNEYHFWLREELAAVSRAEKQPAGLPPLHNTKSRSQGLPVDPTTSPPGRFRSLSSRSHLVMRLLAVKIGHDFLLQIFNKLLALASNADQQPNRTGWNSLLVSTQGVWLRCVVGCVFVVHDDVFSSSRRCRLFLVKTCRSSLISGCILSFKGLCVCFVCEQLTVWTCW